MSGSDTGDFDAFDDEGLKVYEDADIRSVLAIENCRVPVICQIQGYVMGLGTCLAAACDMIVASDDAYFGQPEVTICVCGGTGALRQLMPEKFMRYMALTGKKIGVQKIAEFGQIYSVVPREQALDEAYALARRSGSSGIIASMMLKDPKRDEVLAAHNEMLRKKREAKEKARREAEGKQ